MVRPINTIHLMYDELTQSEKLISEVIMEHPDEVLNMTIRDLAKASYCSPALITKFLHKIGYDSYIIFKEELKCNATFKNDPIFNSFSLVDNYVSENQILFFELVNRIFQANTIFIFASGQSQVPALDFYGKLKRRNINAHFEVDITLDQVKAAEISDNDIVIFISNSGESRELLYFSKIIENEIILITNKKGSRLSKIASNEYCLENMFDDIISSRNYPQASKYSLIYFLDLIFMEISNLDK